jgi:hypothetical protein
MNENLIDLSNKNDNFQNNGNELETENDKEVKIYI